MSGIMSSSCMVLYNFLWLYHFSSLPRTTVIIDFTLTLLFFLFNTRTSDQSLGHKIDDQFYHFNYQTDNIDLVFISFFRSIILFYCFGNKQNIARWQEVYMSVILVTLSTIYLISKLSVHEKVSVRNLSVISLLFSWIEMGLFLQYEGNE
eukprot:UN29314